ncbi:MAG: STAS domain-containing protein [Bryobacterales bacterium]|nr:STAS domain-containing protein [Bryobacterales bacterium]
MIDTSSKATAERCATLRLSGPLGLAQAAGLLELAREALASPEEAVRLDWRGAEGVSAAALQVLLALEADLKLTGRKLEPGPAPESVRKMLGVCGLDRMATAAKAKAKTGKKREAVEEQDSVANGARG